MQRLEVSDAVRPIYGSLGVKRLIDKQLFFGYCVSFVIFLRIKLNKIKSVKTSTVSLCSGFVRRSRLPTHNPPPPQIVSDTASISACTSVSQNSGNCAGNKQFHSTPHTATCGTSPVSINCTNTSRRGGRTPVFPNNAEMVTVKL